MCVFPFQYKGKEYNECTSEGYNNTYWCGTTYAVTASSGTWGMCSGPCKLIAGKKSKNIDLIFFTDKKVHIAFQNHF